MPEPRLSLNTAASYCTIPRMRAQVSGCDTARQARGTLRHARAKHVMVQKSHAMADCQAMNGARRQARTPVRLSRDDRM